MLTVGFAMKGEINPKAIWEIADMLVEAQNAEEDSEVGIKTAVRKSKK
jgi:major membrane immunogen (membrane-anchored lipoprotein)